jgi:hypothetical protein
MENSLTSMKAAFPTAPKPVQGILMLQSLIELMLHRCRCAQTNKTPVLKNMNMLFCAAAPDLYAFFTKEAYPRTFFLFPKEVEEVPNFNNCTDANQHETLKMTPALAKKTRADIVTMNAALSDLFLANLPKSICKGYDPIAWDCQTLSSSICLIGSSKNEASRRPKKERRINNKWPPIGSPPTVLSSLSCSSSLARCTQVQQGIQWKSATSLTLAYV